MATRLIQPTLVHSVTYVTESHCWTLTCHLLYDLHCWELYIVSLYNSNRRQYDPPNSNLETSIFFTYFPWRRYSSIKITKISLLVQIFCIISTNLCIISATLFCTNSANYALDINGTKNFFCITSKNTKKRIANSFRKFYQMVRRKWTFVSKNI